MKWLGNWVCERAGSLHGSVRAEELGKLDRRIARRMGKAVEELSTDPPPPGCRALAGRPGLWRIRVSDSRVVHAIKDAELLVLALRVVHRSDVHRGL
ncbi:mRNA interferase RelE/StbE [Saccharopolyspora lacisalsi]|uniref:mRNA interferase RelE/StbE n=1 Tax=Halosaccharopolyspora lacisalsi TaxID=1000566 RepID=A0A839DVB4_9PSEU|nr:type II toxin-antitoxin system RelE/ParE family toxin [Halosaccharopolyspora lacisalsi]MBA8823337.1 mRNA interferase RelE/StbE [Halosaccharopolyspora lacisalsi]